MKVLIPSIAFLVGLASPLLVHAQLGGDASTIEKDAKFLGSEAKTTQKPVYSLHEISKNWLKLHEFNGQDGKVFAIAWQGSRHPDLQTLLGEHFRDFQTAMNQARKNHRHGGVIITEVGNLHIEMGGRQMAVYGKAWLNDRLPTGMDLNEVK